MSEDIDVEPSGAALSKVLFYDTAVTAVTALRASVPLLQLLNLCM
jgi:hypothetical protein